MVLYNYIYYGIILYNYGIASTLKKMKAIHISLGFHKII